MLNPADFGLKENPFSMVPDADVEYWAGLPETKRAFSDVVVSVCPDDVGSSEFVVICGNWGAGKSHALRYFTHRINKAGSNYAVYLNEVMVGTNLSFANLCPRILEHLKGAPMTRITNTLKESVDTCADQIRKESGLSTFSPEMAMEEKIPQQDREIVKSLYHYGQLPVWGKEDYSATTGLASLFRVMTSPIGHKQPAFGAVYLFLDELETVFDEKAPKQLAFFSALRSLINGMTEHFALVLSFSAPTALLEAAVPSALKERMTRPFIQCEPLTEDSAKQFVREYLGFVRPSPSFSPPQPFYPFSEATINTIFERETALVPRRILLHLRRVWERAVRYESLKPGEEISKEMAETILEGVI